MVPRFWPVVRWERCRWSRGQRLLCPVKNKAYESNEQLAKMRAQRARDAIITALSAEGLEVASISDRAGLEGGQPRIQGCVQGQSTYRNFQYAKFSSGVNSWRNDGDWTHLRAMNRIDLNLPLSGPLSSLTSRPPARMWGASWRWPS